MSAQINLYHPRFLKQHDPLALGNVAIAVIALYVVLALAGGWIGMIAAQRTDAAAVVGAQLKEVTDQVTAETAALENRKPDPRLIAELKSIESLLERRGQIALLLESGSVGSTGGFAEYLRGFARQVPEGLWLTGFTIGSGGNDMEIRGSMLAAVALPEYIRRLGTEKAFQGRSFASLTMGRAEPPVAAPGKVVAVSPAPTSAQPIDFVLMPKLVDKKENRP